MQMITRVQNLSDKELISGLEKTRKLERKAQAVMLCHLAEVERRKLFAIKGYSSMFGYVTQSLSFSEASALKRIQVARAAMRYPQIYDLIEQVADNFSIQRQTHHAHKHLCH